MGRRQKAAPPCSRAPAGAAQTAPRDRGPESKQLPFARSQCQVLPCSRRQCLSCSPAAVPAPHHSSQSMWKPPLHSTPPPYSLLPQSSQGRTLAKQRAEELFIVRLGSRWKLLGNSATAALALQEHKGAGVISLGEKHVPRASLVQGRKTAAFSRECLQGFSSICSVECFM